MAGYLGSVPVPQATQHRESFTCTEGQTSFATAGYTAQFVDVYLNGSHLSPADFTATNGSDVVLAVAASADDVCDIISYTPFEIASPVFTGSATFNEGSADADFRVESNGNENMLFVDGGNNRVGIGTNTPQVGTLHVHTATAGTVTASPQADDLVVESNTEAGITILSPDDQSARIRFSSPSTNTEVGGASIFYRQNLNKMSIGTAVTGGTMILRSGADVDAVVCNGAGIVTMPLQPAFLAHLSATLSNLTTGSPETTIKFDSEIFDQNGDFTVATGNGQGADNNNLRGAFTAPVTGKYQFNFHFRLNTVQNDINFMYFFIKSSNRNYTNIFEYSGADDAAYYTVTLSVLADMDEDDTAYVNAYQSGGSAETDIEGGTSNASFFSGYLVA